MSENQRVWVVDRVEAGLAVLVADDEETLDIPLNLLPAGTEEGSVLLVAEQVGGPAWSSSRLDEERKQEMLQNAEATLSELRKRDPGGDIVL